MDEDRVSDLLCPIMGIGWFSNKYAAKAEDKTFLAKNVPFCHKEKCALWSRGACSFRRSND